MKWEINDVDALGRIGKLIINNKEMITPNLFPVVHPYKNILNVPELKMIGAQCVFTNAYIMYQKSNLREQVLKKGIHNYLDFDGIIATDSGAFQKYMYNKNEIEINAENIENFQERIGSDFPVILDVPIQPTDDYQTAKKKIHLSIKRAKDNINRRTKESCHWYGPIHGGKYLDLLKISIQEMSKLNFSVYALGGLVKSLLNYRFDLVIKILLNVKKNLVWNKPLHLFGLGLPQFFSLAVASGCDLMDSAAYVLYAKEKRYFTLSTGTRNLGELDEFPCHCPICCKFEPKEVKKLDEDSQIELLAKHNLYLSFSELRTIRQAIKEGNLWELVEQRVRSHPNLVNALNLIKQSTELIEKHEKLYKSHGRLLASPESSNRPILYRYDLKMKRNYRIPSDAQFLILLPELDVKGYNSPTIRRWLEEIDSNLVIPRSNIHVVFYSDIFGIIPLELSYTFPMGQYESRNILEKEDLHYQSMVLKLENYFKIFGNYYKKCSVLIPDKFINQFNEETEFFPKKIIFEIFSGLKSRLSLNLTILTNINKILSSL
ncbi:MAG: tRNA guanosine(15) transglycosylase TgtA [Promethearchaeota archaeon]